MSNRSSHIPLQFGRRAALALIAGRRSGRPTKSSAEESVARQPRT